MCANCDSRDTVTLSNDDEFLQEHHVHASNHFSDHDMDVDVEFSPTVIKVEVEPTTTDNTFERSEAFKIICCNN